MADTSVIIVCAGNATRMGGINKILMPLGKSNVVGHSMLAFEQCEDIAEILTPFVKPLKKSALPNFPRL